VPGARVDVPGARVDVPGARVDVPGAVVDVVRVVATSEARPDVLWDREPRPDVTVEGPGVGEAGV